MKNENKIYRLAQKIDDYDADKDGCYWGHILDIVEKAYALGRDSKEIAKKELLKKKPARRKI